MFVAALPNIVAAVPARVVDSQTNKRNKQSNPTQHKVPLNESLMLLSADSCFTTFAIAAMADLLLSAQEHNCCYLHNRHWMDSESQHTVHRAHGRRRTYCGTQIAPGTLHSLYIGNTDTGHFDFEETHI